jgi:tRNA threonylcarbamoyladenosine biosynthesis protein TsaB
MAILAIDTSTEYLSLAILIGDQVFFRDIHAVQSHSKQILPMIDSLLEDAKISLDDLTGIALGAGPGSFTGLRIACGVTQGIAFAKNLPVVEVSTLEALAYQSGEEKVIACLDARVNEVYYAAYQKKNGELVQVHDVSLFKPNEVPSLTGSDWVGVGSGWFVYHDELSEAYQHQLKLPLYQNIHPSAVAIAKLALPSFEKGCVKAAHEISPIYVRNKVAMTALERQKKS